MKRIVHIVGSMNRAGAETMIMNLYRNIDSSKYQFDFVCFTSNICDFDEEILERGGTIYRVTSSKNSSFKTLSRYYKYFLLLRSLKCDHGVHSHMNINNSVYLFIAYLAGVKSRISHSHGSEGKYHQGFIRKLYKSISFIFIKTFATNYIACGELAGNYLYPKVDKSKVVLLPNAIDIEGFAKHRLLNRDYIRRFIDIDENAIIITQIGRLSTVKNHIYSLDILKSLKKNGIKFHFVIIGGGELKAALEKQTQEEGLESEITFLGVRSDVPELLSGSDCLLMPSLHEGFPVVLVESQAIGLPSLISNSISSEVDLELGLVEFASLKDALSIWEEKLIALVNREEVDENLRLKILTEKGFNILESVKKLEHIYG